jgi:hypothetical protein
VLDEQDEQLLDAILAQPHGQLVVQGTDDIARSIAVIGDAFTEWSVFVVAKNSARAKRIHHLISGHTARRYALFPDLPWKMRIKPWSTIGTVQLFGVADLDPWQVAIYADVESVLAAGTVKQLEYRRDFFCYCFMSPHARLCDRERFQLEMLVGPEIYRHPDFKAQPAHVDVVLLKSPPPPRAARKSPVDNKRAQIWRNDGRNRLVADIANGIQRGQSRQLLASGLLTERQAQVIFADRRYPKTAVLVENREHGEQLHRLLPQWSLRSGHQASGCIPLVLTRDIATMIYAEEYAVEVDVLIRADGNPDWPLSPGIFPRISRSPYQVVVVDFAPLGSKRHAQRLRRSYQDRGWNVID